MTISSIDVSDWSPCISAKLNRGCGAAALPLRLVRQFRGCQTANLQECAAFSSMSTTYVRFLVSLSALKCAQHLTVMMLSVRAA